MSEPLEDNNELLQQLLEHSPAGIIILDDVNRVELTNTSFIHMFPDLNPSVGVLIQDLFPQFDFYRELSGEEGLTVRVSFRDKELMVRIRQLKNKRQLWMIDDLSALTKEEISRREFVANVSHELRTPATAITGYAQLLLDEKDLFDEDTQYMISAIHRNAARLNSLFNDLLTLSKIDMGKVRLELEPIRLRGLVNEAVDKQQARADQNGIVFQVMVADSLKVNAHRDALNHIIGNLVENAVKYNRPNGLVTIRASYKETRNKVLLEVIDLGLGIAPADQERIFERFYRVDKGRTRAIGGTGLGLSIVRRFVDLIGAGIELRSQENKGSIFRVFLQPVQEE